MTGKQNAVMWMGVILIALYVVVKWSEIKNVIFKGSGSSSSGSSSSGSSGSSGGNSVQVPIDPFLPTGPKITVPIPKLLTTTLDKLLRWQQQLAQQPGVSRPVMM